ncbi:MAG: hypothetical protein AABX60_04390, partial [Nanoarchaeota archaeon]
EATPGERGSPGVVTVASTPIDSDLRIKEYSAPELCRLFGNTTFPLVSLAGMKLPTVILDDIESIVFHDNVFNAHPDLVEFGNKAFPERLHEGHGFTNGTNLRALRKDGKTLHLGLIKFFDNMRYANAGGRAIFPPGQYFEGRLVSDITGEQQSTLWELDVKLHELDGKPYDVSTALVPHYFGGGIAALPRDGGMIFVGQRIYQRDGITKAQGGGTFGVGGYTIWKPEFIDSIRDGSRTVEDVVEEHVRIHAEQKLGITTFEPVRTVYVWEPGGLVAPITFIKTDMATKDIALAISNGVAANVQHAVARFPLREEDLQLTTQRYRLSSGSLAAAKYAAEQNLNRTS